MSFSVCDLHCDLLSYLIMGDERTPYLEESRCSLPQLKRGSVSFQTLAVFCETAKGSKSNGNKQFTAFQKFQKAFEKEQVKVMLALENASSIAEEDEPLEQALSWLEKVIKNYGPLLYVSLTWNTENRFGGGNFSSAGLKKDGEALLDFLHGRKIAIDLSHASDRLALDIFNYIDNKGLDLPIIASHSNFRKIKDHKRNLPDEIAKEIIKRKGLIGINFFRPFVGDNFRDNFIQIVEHALFLGGEETLCFGADFFSDQDFNSTLSQIYSYPFFNEEFGNSSCYPEMQKLLFKHFPEKVVENIAHKNVNRFLQINR